MYGGGILILGLLLVLYGRDLLDRVCSSEAGAMNGYVIHPVGANGAGPADVRVGFSLAEALTTTAVKRVPCTTLRLFPTNLLGG